MSTSRQCPSWERRGGWGKLIIISRGVEISIAGPVGEMVCGLTLGQFFFFCTDAFIVFRYKKPYTAQAIERTKPINPNK